MKIKLDEADRKFSQWIRLRDKMCLRCRVPVQLNAKGLPTSLQASHFQSRRKENTRFDEDNVNALCFSCHQYLGENPAEHYQWQVERLGQERVDELIILSNMYVKRDRKSEAIYWKQRLKEDFGV